MAGRVEQGWVEIEPVPQLADRMMQATREIRYVKEHDAREDLTRRQPPHRPSGHPDEPQRREHTGEPGPAAVLGAVSA